MNAKSESIIQSPKKVTKIEEQKAIKLEDKAATIIQKKYRLFMNYLALKKTIAVHKKLRCPKEPSPSKSENENKINESVKRLQKMYRRYTEKLNKQYLPNAEKCAKCLISKTICIGKKFYLLKAFYGKIKQRLEIHLFNPVTQRSQKFLIKSFAFDMMSTSEFYEKWKEIERSIVYDESIASLKLVFEGSSEQSIIERRISEINSKIFKIAADKSIIFEGKKIFNGVDYDIKVKEQNEGKFEIIIGNDALLLPENLISTLKDPYYQRIYAQIAFRCVRLNEKGEIEFNNVKIKEELIALTFDSNARIIQRKFRKKKKEKEIKYMNYGQNPNYELVMQQGFKIKDQYHKISVFLNIEDNDTLVIKSNKASQAQILKLSYRYSKEDVKVLLLDKELFKRLLRKELPNMYNFEPNPVSFIHENKGNKKKNA